MATGPINVSIRDQIIPVIPGQSVFDAVRSIGTRSLEALVDVNDHLPHFRLSDGTTFSLRDHASVQKLQDRLRVEEVRISAFLLATDFSGDDAERHVDWAVRVINAACELGTPVVRIDPLTARDTLGTSTIRDNFIRRARSVLEQTADTGVDLGMENHGRLFNDPELLDAVLAALPDGRFGLTLDTGNLYWWGHPISQVYQLVERYAPRTKHTHIKNINYPSEIADQRREIGFEYKRFCGPLYQGNLDLDRIVQSLRRGGYQRDLCVEDESLFKVPESERIEVLRRDVESLQKAAAP